MTTIDLEELALSIYPAGGVHTTLTEDLENEGKREALKVGFLKALTMVQEHVNRKQLWCDTTSMVLQPFQDLLNP